MATVVQRRPDTERRHHERRQGWTAAVVATDGMRVSWGGIWGGVLVALGVLMLLTALGLAIGVSAVDPGQTASSTIGAGAGIWGSLSLLIALFVGGLAATRIGAITDRTTGFFEGALVWVVSRLDHGLSGRKRRRHALERSVPIRRRRDAGARRRGPDSGRGANVDVSGTVDEIAQRLRSAETAEQVANVTGLQPNEVRTLLNQTALRVEDES